MFVINGGVRKAIVCYLTIWFSGGVWKAIVCSITIWFSGDVCEITDMPLTLSTVVDIVMLEITISCGVCMEALCVIMVAAHVGPSAVGPYNSFVGVVVIVKLPCCDVSPVTGVRIEAITGSNNIIGLMGLVGVPRVPSVLSDAIFEC
ncbi:unnamed protein product [Lactuca virosa]|uniref:Uncharacterized protein n=1 Tax=Lactuca virosa TaxID=75947 RepID=A0AAU9NTL5_9ASTR|nr:unnamed protein product [Lactuca virosa]